MIGLIKKIAVPISTACILSSCLLLAWHLYRTVYTPLFQDLPITTTAKDYAIPQAKLQATLDALDQKTNVTELPSVTHNPFLRSAEE